MSKIDEINYNIIKNCIGALTKPLKHIFNLSLLTGVFPDQLKMARVTPTFKSGEKTTVSNYRPISILPCFSKILERIMYNRLYKFLQENKFSTINNLVSRSLIQLTMPLSNLQTKSLSLLMIKTLLLEYSLTFPRHLIL